jgi:hypothetical protein
MPAAVKSQTRAAKPVPVDSPANSPVNPGPVQFEVISASDAYGLGHSARLGHSDGLGHSARLGQLSVPTHKCADWLNYLIAPKQGVQLLSAQNQAERLILLFRADQRLYQHLARQLNPAAGMAGAPVQVARAKAAEATQEATRAIAVEEVKAQLQVSGPQEPGPQETEPQETEPQETVPQEIILEPATARSVSSRTRSRASTRQTASGAQTPVVLEISASKSPRRAAG